MPNPKSPLEITPLAADGGVVLKSAAGDMHIRTSHPATSFAGLERADYAAWYFLPIAMRLGRPLFIHGTGSAATAAGFQKMSRIWQSWLPGHFSATTVHFSKPQARAPLPAAAGDLLFYSGGLDATHVALKRLNTGQRQDVLTIRGMDYSLSDEEAFARLLAKTDAFAARLSSTRIILQSNAYDLYRRHGVNLKDHHLAHAFALAGAGFFHAGHYRNLILAADERIDGEFMTFPWGTNLVTNRLFQDDQTAIVTEGDAWTRIEKLITVQQSPDALQSLSFCWNRRIQPDNCGVCRKCLRTKLLSLAALGRVPEIFVERALPADWPERLRYKAPAEQYALQEIWLAAEEHGNAHLIPGLQPAQRKALAHYRGSRARHSPWRWRLGLKGVWARLRRIAP